MGCHRVAVHTAAFVLLCLDPELPNPYRSMPLDYEQGSQGKAPRRLRGVGVLNYVITSNVILIAFKICKNVIEYVL